MTAPNKDVDLLYGVPAISDCLGLEPDQVYYLHKKKKIPTFKIDRIVCARRSTLVSWLAAKEAEAAKPDEQPKGER